MKNTGLFLLFAVVTIFELYSEVTLNRTIHLFSKPFIAIIPILFVLLSKAKRDIQAKQLILAGLFFSWIGDCVLMFREEYSWAFLGGLGAFFVAHIMYILAYRIGSKGKFTLTYFVVIPILGYGIVLYSVLAPFLGSLKIPVAVYSLILLGMVLAAVERSNRTNKLSFRMVSLGAVLFLISDSVLAWSIFVENSVVARVLVMSTYSTAQILITVGMITHWQQDNT